MVWQETTYSSLRDGVRGLLGLARKLGVAKGGDRLHLLFRFMDQVVEAQQQGRLQEFADANGHLYVLWVLSEAREFSEMMPWIRSYPEAFLASKLEQALKGPLTPLKETSASNRGRNVAFELNLGTRLIANGVRLEALSDVDVAADLDGHLVLLQCKRPFSDKKFRKNVMHAYRQLTRDTDSLQPRWGVIVVSVNRVLNPASKPFMRDRKQGRDLIDVELLKLTRRHSRLWRTIINPRILGAILHVQTPAYYRADPLPITSLQKGHVIPFHDPGSLESILLLRLTSALSKDGWVKYG